MLVQQASGFNIGGHNFHIRDKPMQKDQVAASLPKAATPVQEHFRRKLVFLGCYGSSFMDSHVLFLLLVLIVLAEYF